MKTITKFLVNNRVQKQNDNNVIHNVEELHLLSNDALKGKYFKVGKFKGMHYLGIIDDITKYPNAERLINTFAHVYVDKQDDERFCGTYIDGQKDFASDSSFENDTFFELTDLDYKIIDMLLAKKEVPEQMIKQTFKDLKGYKY